MRTLIHPSLYGVLAAVIVSVHAVTACAGEFLVVESVAVKTTNPDGQSWDPGGGAPDIKIRVERTSAPAGEMHITAPQKNRFKADINRTVMEVDRNDKLKITILDDDVGPDDVIGSTSVKITAAAIKNKTIKLSFGQVKSLALRIK